MMLLVGLGNYLWKTVSSTSPTSSNSGYTEWLELQENVIANTTTEYDNKAKTPGWQSDKEINWQLTDFLDITTEIYSANLMLDMTIAFYAKMLQLFSFPCFCRYLILPLCVFCIVNEENKKHKLIWKVMCNEQWRTTTAYCIAFQL